MRLRGAALALLVAALAVSASPGDAQAQAQTPAQSQPQSLPRLVFGPPPTGSGHPGHPIKHRHQRLGSATSGGTATSTNWAGYDATGGGFSSVTGTWTQPSVPSTGSTTSYAAFWVGLDGDGSSTVEQTGTAAYSYHGVVYYSAWYEMYPAASVPIAGLTISPGDVMTAGVSSDGLGHFTLTITDVTSGHSYSTTKSGGPTNPYSAEVIAEAPTNATTGKLFPLADFGTLHFTNGTFNGQPIGSYNWNRIAMVSGTGAPVAVTSPLGATKTLQSRFH